MTLRIVFRISVLVLVIYSAVTQKCPAGGRSESSIVGWMLRGHVYDTLLAELPFTCVFKCREDNRCQSFNWVISLLTCEFNNRTKEARPEDFIPNPNRSYYRRDLERVPLGSIQELPAESCDVIKRSEGHAVSGKYWFSTIKSGTSVRAYCNMETNEKWKKINTGPVCFRARGDSYGAFNIRVGGVIYTFKLVHLSGSIRCNPGFSPSYWGCDNPGYGDTRLLTVLTFKNKSALLLADYKRKYCDYRYKIEGVGVNDTELQFNNLPSPISVSVGDEFQIWYGQDLTNCSEDNNSGQTCADVYAWYA
ncbi:unnamed protein product [Porites evermanni]|uniref:Apple domain-containing protein n=1 Tax=Porites evermanni TaxID=104178 RepID=A0ABN8RN28_9CNID|nr:unnamed protein product [Porites evermanni]